MSKGLPSARLIKISKTHLAITGQDTYKKNIKENHKKCLIIFKNKKRVSDQELNNKLRVGNWKGKINNLKKMVCLL
ncbi:MAG: hypothetical protein MRERV_3c021 [Mycoplasmataceae bacterium RV_VA103A]|nr:MAG: hypothetical protein MRERV_3c021 [Mycoplasmataceae bacterium RV_VA103A]